MPRGNAKPINLWQVTRWNLAHCQSVKPEPLSTHPNLLTRPAWLSFQMTFPWKRSSFIQPSIKGDGNCLPRSTSLLAYGNENRHKEMRERIVSELSKNADLYLNDNLMKTGMNPEGNQSVAKTFASYFNCYMANRLNKNSIRKVYQEETMSISKNGSYMGLWQLASLANILSSPVVSVYPKYGSHTIRSDMHHVF